MADGLRPHTASASELSLRQSSRCGGERLLDPLGRRGGGFDLLEFVPRFDGMQREASTAGLELQGTAYAQMIAASAGLVLARSKNGF